MHVNDKNKKEGSQMGKILVAFFSHSGNTEAVANQIKEKVSSDLFEIKTVESYPADYNAVVDKAKKEQAADYRPILGTKVDMDLYDVIFIGYPNWWGTTPMAIFSFFEEYDFSGKTIIAFFIIIITYFLKINVFLINDSKKRLNEDEKNETDKLDDNVFYLFR